MSSTHKPTRTHKTYFLEPICRSAVALVDAHRPGQRCSAFVIVIMMSAMNYCRASRTPPDRSNFSLLFNISTIIKPAFTNGADSNSDRPPRIRQLETRDKTAPRRVIRSEKASERQLLSAVNGGWSCWSVCNFKYFFDLQIRAGTGHGELEEARDSEVRTANPRPVQCTVYIFRGCITVHVIGACDSGCIWFVVRREANGMRLLQRLGVKP